MSVTLFEANIKLSEAIIRKNCEELKQWLPKADVYGTSGDPKGLSPFHRLYSCRSLEIIDLALQGGVNPNCPLIDMDCQTLIYGAIRNVQPEIIKLLLKYKAKLNVVDANGDTPFSFAVRNEDRIKLVPLLIKLGADVRLGNSIFSVLKKDPERLSELQYYLRECFEEMIFEKSFAPLKKVLQDLKTLKNVPQDFMDDFESFEDLANFSEENGDEFEGLSHQKAEFESMKHFDEETDDTVQSNSSLSRSQSSDGSHYCSHDLEGKHGKCEEKNCYHNKSAKPQQSCEQIKEGGSDYLLAFHNPKH